MTMLKTKNARELAGVIAAVAGLCTIGTAACQVDVISGDDGEGGQGGQGGAGAVVVSTTVGTTSVTTTETTVGGTTIASTGYTTGSVTAGSGMCPPDANWGSQCGAVGSTAAGGEEKFCMWQKEDCPQEDGIEIECDGSTGFCTCTGSGTSCFCLWDVPAEIGQCGTPCCGGNPNAF